MAKTPSWIRRLACWLAAILAGCLVPKLHAAERPNIIVILSDDLGYADLGAHGVREDVRTPNLVLLR